MNPRLITDDAAFDRELEMNRAAYESLRDQIKREHAGKYIGIAFGKLVIAAPTFDEAARAVDSLTPTPQHSLVLPADEDPDIDAIIQM